MVCLLKNKNEVGMKIIARYKCATGIGSTGVFFEISKHEQQLNLFKLEWKGVVYLGKIDVFIFYCTVLNSVQSGND